MKKLLSLLMSMMAVVSLHAQEPMSVTWLSSDTDTFGQTIISNSTFVSETSWDAGTLESELKTAFDVDYTAFAGGEDGTGGYVPISFSFTPSAGYFFIPSQVSFKACKFGSDNCFAKVNVTYGDGTTETVAELTDVADIGRNNGSPEPKTHTYQLDKTKVSGGKIILTIGLSIAKNNKKVGLANVCLSGKIAKGIAVSVKANKETYGSVAASKITLLEGEELTLTATPRRGCQFVNWTDENGTEISTDAEYTFVPTADVDYRGNFSIEEGYVERSFENAPFFINWPLTDSTTPDQVTFTRSTVFENSFEADKRLTLSPNTNQDENYTCFLSDATEAVWNDFNIKFSFTPSDGLTFKPSQLSFKAFQTGSDIGNISAYITYGDGSEGEIYLGNEVIARYEAQEYLINLDGSKAVTGTITVRLQLSIYGNRRISIRDLTVTGSMDGTIFVNEYYISTKCNNDEYGVTKVLQETIQVGAQATLTAIPNRGYRFVGWTDDDAEGAVVSTEPSYTFVPEGDINYTANFEALPEYTVNVTSADAGMGIVNVSAFEDGKYFSGDELVIEARPSDGYLFSKWSDGNSDWRRSVTLKSNLELTAMFISLPEPPFIAKWGLSENTDVTLTGNLYTDFSIEGCTDLETTKTVGGIDFRLFQPIEYNGTCILTFSLSPIEENKSVVVGSVEFDAIRNASYGNIDIQIVGEENDVTFDAGRPESDRVSHYYYNTSMEEGATAVNIIFSGCSDTKQYAFANVKLQGYLKDVTATSISQTIASDAKSAVFSLGGQRVTAQRKGLNIVRMNDGTVKKVMVK